MTVMNAVAFVADDALLVIPGWEVCAFAFCRFRPLIPIIIVADSVAIIAVAIIAVAMIDVAMSFIPSFLLP
ncbi:MAG: hypothetical protein WCE91_03915 [Nitrososphaeraceae archaeon]